MLADQAMDLFGVPLSPEQVQQFDDYAKSLAGWNAHTNLTAIIEPDAVRVRHFLDSLSLAGITDFNRPQRLIDIGTGAGFPGLPLAIAYEKLHVTVMDSTGKKVRFLQHVIDALKLTNARAIQARAEEAGQDAEHRATYDVVTARAVARLPALLEYMLPLAKVGGVCVAMKGITAEEEANSAAPAMNMLGGTLSRIEAVQLPGVDEAHNLVVVKKAANTPSSYPRRPGIPTKHPLE